MSLCVVFRVDATQCIGTGHFMRCLTLAGALKEVHARVRLISRGLPSHLAEMVVARGLEYVALPDDTAHDGSGDLVHSAWLPVTQAQDARDTLQALSGVRWDWLVVDHYALDARWESTMRGTATCIMAIDDLADRAHDCDLLLDQNLYSDMPSRYEGKVPAHCRLLLGPRYALLRPEFAEVRKQAKPRTGGVKRILVFFGGVDAGNYTGKAIQALSGLGKQGIAVDVVIGAQHPYRPDIEQACAALGQLCHVQTPHMAALTAAADLSIGAGGSALWERYCLGLPSFCLCTADNQREQLADAAKAGLVYAPLIYGDVVDLIRRHALTLIENPALLQWLSCNTMNTVDGLGAQRCAAEMSARIAASEGNTVTVRLATDQDAAGVWPWRNDEATRRHFFVPSPVGLEGHLAWWRGSLTDSRRVLLIGELSSQAFGVLRFDLEPNGTALVSIYLDPVMTGRRLGATLLRTGLDWLKKHRPEISAVKAEVLEENAASQKIFLRAGFSKQYQVLVRKV